MTNRARMSATIPPARSGDNCDLSFGQQRFGLSIRKCDFAIVLDHAHNVVAQLADIRRHRLLIRELLTVEHEFFLHRPVVQRLFVSHADVGR